MEIGFDAAKDKANRLKHGVFFARAKDMDILVVRTDGRRDYGEERYRAWGLLGGGPMRSPSASSPDGLSPSACVERISRSTEVMSRDDIEARLAQQPEPDLTDPDNPEWTREDFARAIPADQFPPDVLAAFPNTRLGRPKSAVVKVAVKLRIDPDVLDAYKATGSGWQTRINDTLRRALPH